MHPVIRINNSKRQNKYAHTENTQKFTWFAYLHEEKEREREIKSILFDKDYNAQPLLHNSQPKKNYWITLLLRAIFSSIRRTLHLKVFSSYKSIFFFSYGRTLRPTPLNLYNNASITSSTRKLFSFHIKENLCLANQRKSLSSTPGKNLPFHVKENQTEFN